MKKLITLAALALMAGMITAQNPQWVQYSNGEYITALAEEGNYIWVGTTTGLVKLNKHTDERVFYNYFNSSLPYNWINAIAIDSNGVKWIGTPGGLTSYDGQNWTTYNSSNSELETDYVARIVIDVNGVKWISCSYKWHIISSCGLTSFDGTTWTNYNTYNSGIPASRVSAIAPDKEGYLWVGTYFGLATFDGNNWTDITELNSGLPGNYINSITVDEDNTKLITGFGSTGYFLVTYNGEAWNIVETPQQVMDINDLTIDTNDDIWLITWSSMDGEGGIGAWRYSYTSWIFYDSSNSMLPNARVNALLIDDEGTKWFGTDKGLVSFDNVSWKLHNTSNHSMVDNFQIRSVQVEDDKIWLNTYIGLVSFDNDMWQIYNSSNSPIQPYYLSPTQHIYIYNFCIDKNGTKWLTQGGIGEYSLLSFDGNNWTVYDTIASGQVYNIQIDNNGIIWHAFKKLQSFDGTNWMVYDIPDLGANDYISHIAIEPDGKIWLTTCNIDNQVPVTEINLYSFDGTLWAIFNIPTSLLGNIVDFAIDEGGKKWFVIGNKLVVFDGENWTKYTTENSGLPYDYVEVLDIDVNGNIWVGMWASPGDGGLKRLPAGIACYDGTNWNSFSNLPFRATSFSMDKHGTVWIGTYSDGLMAYNPSGVPLSNPENTVPEKAQLKIYPNPSSSLITVEAPCDGTLSIFNLNGKLIREQGIKSGATSIDVSSMPQGMYVLRFIGGAGVENVKFLKR